MQDDLVAMKFFFEDVCICFYLFLAKCLKKICTYHVVFHTPQFHTLLPSHVQEAQNLFRPVYFEKSKI